MERCLKKECKNKVYATKLCKGHYREEFEKNVAPTHRRFGLKWR